MKLAVLLAALALAAFSEATYLQRDIFRARRRRPLRLVLGAGHRQNPVTGVAFCDPKPRRLIQPIIQNGFLSYNKAILRQLVGPRRVSVTLKRLQQLRRVLAPQVLRPISNYFAQLRLAGTLPPRLLVRPRLQLSPALLQRGLLQFIIRIPPGLLTQIQPSVFTGIRSDLVGINPRFALPQTLLPQLYSTYISVISGNGRGSYLLGLKPLQRYQQFATTLGVYLGDNLNVLPNRLRQPSLLLQDFAATVDSRFILTNSGLVVQGQRVPDAADAFFEQLEADHINAVNEVLNDIYNVQRSIDLSALPQLGYPGLLARSFYPGLDPVQTDIVARYLLSGLTRPGGARTPGLVSALGILPYYGGLSSGLVPAIRGSNLRSLLGSLQEPLLRPLLTPNILKAALQPRTITQILLAAFNQGIVPRTTTQAIELYRLAIAGMMIENRKPEQFYRLLTSRLGAFQTALRVTLPNIRPAIIRQQIPIYPINTLTSIQDAILRRQVTVPSTIFRLVQTQAPAVTTTTTEATTTTTTTPEPQFPDITISGTTIPGVNAEQIFTILQGLLPGFPEPLLQPTLQLFAPSTLIPAAALTNPVQLVRLVRQKLVPVVQPIITNAISAASVPSFVQDSAFTLPAARLAFGLESLVLASRGYTVLPKPLISSVVPATLRAYYGVNSAFAPASFLDYSLQYYPQLVGSGQLAAPLTFGSTTLNPLQVTSVLSGLRGVYGPFSYHGLATILASKEAGKILEGVDLRSTDAIAKALTFGLTNPLVTAAPNVTKSIAEILKPISSRLFDQIYAVQDLQGLLGFSLNYLRVPSSLVTPAFPDLFTRSVQRLVKIQQPLITGASYNPFILDQDVNLIVDELVEGRLAPELDVKLPTGQLALTPQLLIPFNTQLVKATGLRLLPTFTSQILTNYFTTSPELRQVAPSNALAQFISYIRNRPYVHGFSFHLRGPEYAQVTQALVKTHRLPAIFNTYPARLQNYIYDSLFGSYALSTLSHFSRYNLQSALTHGVLFNSFVNNIAPSFFKHRLTNIVDLYQAAPNYFQLFRSNYRVLQAQYAKGSRLVY